MADQPINYGLRETPMQSFAGGLQVGNALTEMEQQRAALQQQQVAQQQAQQQAIEAQRLMQSVLTNPNATASDYGAVVSANPKFGTQIKEAWDRKTTEQQQASVSTGSKIHSALQSGRNDLAMQILDEQIAALGNSGADNAALKAAKDMKAMVQQSPDYARVMVGSSLAALPGGDKYFSGLKTIGEEGRANAAAPAELLKKTADARKATIEANYADPKTRSEIQDTLSKIEERGSRLGLDREKFNLEFDSTLNKLRQGAGAPAMSPGMEKVQAESVGLAITAKSLADRAAQAAEGIKTAKLNVGGKPLRWLAENSKQIFGTEDGYTALKREFVRIRSQGLLADLPPGPATDKDIEMVKAGYPPDNAEPDVVMTWLNSFSNVQKAIAQKEEAKAEWLSSVGSLRTAPSDVEIMGVRVPAGTSFPEFVRKGIKPEATATTGRPRYLDYGK